MFNLIDSQRGHSNQIHRSKNIDVLKPWAFNQNRQDSQLGQLKKLWIVTSHHTCITCVTMIYSCNSSWTWCHMLSNHLWMTLLITKKLNVIYYWTSFFVGDINSLNFIFIFIQISNLVTNQSFTYNLKSYCSWICNYKLFLPCCQKRH
jgi:hypothetical protein